MALDFTTGTYITFQITSEASSFPVEKRYAEDIKVGDLKCKLELITGASAASMTVKLYRNDQLVTQLDDNDSPIGQYIGGDPNHLRLHVIDASLRSGQFDDVSGVKKFELDDEEYSKRDDSVRAFKMKNKLGRFGESGEKEKEDEENEKMQEEKAKQMGVGERCEVSVKGQARRRGTVLFVGETQFKPGIWVGVKCDEPLGKNDGSVGGHRYFQCPPKYGSFVRPMDVQVGDFPEEGMDLDEM